MVSGLFLFCVANASVLLAAKVVLQRIGTGHPSTDLVILLLTRLLILSLVVLLAGSFGVLSPTTLAALSLFIGCLALAFGGRPRFAARDWPHLSPLILAAAGVVLLRLLIQAWFFAPCNADVLSYHLPKVAEWVRQGGFHREMGVDTHVTLPAGFELIELWWVAFIRHDVLIEVAGLEFLSVSVVSVYSLSRRVGLSENGGALAALFFSLTPGVCLQAVSCMNDGPVAALVLAAAALVAARAPASLLVVPFGLGVGVKPTFLFAVPGLLLLCFLTRKQPLVRIQSTVAKWALPVLSVGIGVYWYVRNALWFGNPIHPVGVEGLTGPNPLQFGPDASSLVSNVLALVNDRIYDKGGPYGALLARIGGWGPLAFSCGVLGLTLQLPTRAEFRHLVASLLVSVLSVLGAVFPDDWCLRFILFFPAVLAIGSAWLVQTFRPVALVAALACTYQFVGTLVPSEMPIALLRDLARQDWKNRSAAAFYRVRPPTGPVGHFADSHVAYLLYGPDYSRSVVYLRSRSAQELLSDMRRGGVLTLYADVSSPEKTRVLKEALDRGWLVPHWGSFYALRE